MFPDVRLMIAAVAASVVALSCGFGVFAAFRVNHEPLARLQAAPLQLVVGNAAPRSLLLAAIASDQHAAQRAEQRRASAAAVPPSAPPAAPAAQPTEQSATAAVTPAAEDQTAAAREAKAETAPSAADGELTAARDRHDAASQAGDQATPNRAAEASMELAPTVAPSATELPLDQAPPVEQIKRESETSPALAPSEAVRAAHVAPPPTAAKPKRTRTARARRSRRTRPIAFAAAGAASFTSAPPQFQTAPQSYPPPTPRQRLVRVKIPARKTAKGHPAVGGPFVGAQTGDTPSQR